MWGFADDLSMGQKMEARLPYFFSTACIFARNVQQSPVIPCTQSESSTPGIHLLHGNLLSKFFVKVKLLQAYLTLLSLRIRCLWDFLSLFLSFPHMTPISWCVKPSTRESPVNYTDQIVLQLALVLIILAASCMKKCNRSFYIDPEKRCMLWGGLKKEQKDTKRLRSLVSTSSVAENKMLRKPPTSRINIEDGKCSLTYV